MHMQEDSFKRNNTQESLIFTGKKKAKTGGKSGKSPGKFSDRSKASPIQPDDSVSFMMPTDVNQVEYYNMVLCHAIATGNELQF